MQISLRNIMLTSRRPYKYEVEYLESTGTQWIDTGINTATISQYITDTAMLGAGAEGSNVAPYLFIGIHASNVFYGYVGQSSPTSIPADNVRHIFEAANTGVVANDGFYIDGVKAKGRGTGTVASAPFYLFACYQSGGINYRLKQKKYAAQIYCNGIITRDFIPVVDWNDKPAMYDKVTNKLFYNAGTGEFNIGRKIIPIEYLETPQSSAYTNVPCLIYTGLSPKLGTEFETKCRFRRTGQITDYGNIVFGMRYTQGSQWRYMVSNYKGYNDGSGYASFWNNSRCPSYRPNLGTVDYVFAYHNGIFTDGHGNSSQIAVSGNPPVSPMPTDWQIYLFCGQNLDTSFRPDKASDPFDGRLYYAKFWQDGALVRDFIPAKDENGVGFMFDKVNRTIYDNAGTGAFITGPEI